MTSSSSSSIGRIGYEPSGIILKSLDTLEPHVTLLILEPFGTFWVLWDQLELFGYIWEHFKIFLEHLDHFGQLWTI